VRRYLKATVPLLAAAAMLGATTVGPVSAGAATHLAVDRLPRVRILDFRFKPGTKTITAGQYIKWINRGAAVHNVTSDDGRFESGNLSTGQKYKFQFLTAGTYGYTCTIHGFAGTIVVNP
jgi:plastocyanin